MLGKNHCVCGNIMKVSHRTETFDVSNRKLIILDVPVEACLSKECSLMASQIGGFEVCSVTTLRRLNFLKEEFRKSINQGTTMNPTIITYPKFILN